MTAHKPVLIAGARDLVTKDYQLKLLDPPSDEAIITRRGLLLESRGKNRGRVVTTLIARLVRLPFDIYPCNDFVFL